MKKIKCYIRDIDEEIEGAKHYAECYVEQKAEGENAWANKFHNMAEDELRHAMDMHDFAVHEIEKLRMVFKPTAEMQDEWDKSHVRYVEQVAWVKQMLSM